MIMDHAARGDIGMQIESTSSFWIPPVILYAVVATT
jgi:hypothetical protein